MTYREGGNIDHRHPSTRVYLEPDTVFRAQLARLDNQVANLAAQERPSLEQREASGTHPKFVN